jgi:hypothetical protein
MRPLTEKQSRYRARGCLVRESARTKRHLYPSVKIELDLYKRVVGSGLVMGNCTSVNGIAPLDGTQHTGHGYYDYPENFTIFCSTNWPPLPDGSNYFENDTASDLYDCIDKCVLWNTGYIVGLSEEGECVGVCFMPSNPSGNCRKMKSMEEGEAVFQNGVDSALFQQDLQGVLCVSREC